MVLATTKSFPEQMELTGGGEGHMHRDIQKKIGSLNQRLLQGLPARAFALQDQEWSAAFALQDQELEASGLAHLFPVP